MKFHPHIKKILSESKKDLLWKKEAEGRVSYHLGWELGEKIWKKMSNVDCSGHFRDNPHFIQLSASELNQYTRLENDHEKSKNGSDWNRILKFQHDMDKIYLPQNVEEYISFDFDYLIGDKLIDGIIDYLWGTDFCSYSLNKKDINLVIEGNIIYLKMVLPKMPNYLFNQKTF